MKVGITSDKWPSTVVHEADDRVQIELREGDGIAIIEIALAQAVDVQKLPKWNITYLYRNGAAVDWRGPSPTDIAEGRANIDRCPRCGRDDGHAKDCPIAKVSARGKPGGLKLRP